MNALSKITKPVIIIGCPRSGTTMLYSLLSESSELHSLYNESRFIFRKLYLKKLEQGISFASDQLLDSDLDEDDYQLLEDEFYKYSFNNKYVGKLIHKVLRRFFLFKPVEALIVALNKIYKNSSSHRLIEKTPRNCFKVEVLDKLFPDAKFIFIKRDPRSNISSLIEGWRKRSSTKNSKRLPALRYDLNIEGYEGEAWKFALPPGWQDFKDVKLEELCAYQWLKSNESALEGLAKVSSDRKLEISYEDLVENSSAIIEKVCDFAEIEFTANLQKLAAKPPEVNYLDDKPAKEKWRKNEELINSVLPRVEKLADKLGYTHCKST